MHKSKAIESIDAKFHQYGEYLDTLSVVIDMIIINTYFRILPPILTVNAL